MAEITPAPARAPSKAVLVLGALVVVSVVVRVLVAWRHTIPRLFPDEYIYTALARSIGHGRLEIRGETAHFPGILEPILAAPLWRAFSSATAYHLVQVENAIAASLAAIPIYLLARRLRLSSGYALASAVCALLIPELVVIAYTSSDAIAYPLALAAVAAAVFAIDEPRPRNQVVFLVFATLATAARVQYFVLVPAYIVAAAAIERRELWRRHRIAVIALAPVGVAFLIGLFGFYARERDTPLNANYAKWFFLQAFLLAIEAGVVIVPGAVAAILRPRTRTERGFAVMAGTTTVLLLAEATAHAANSQEFKERYLVLIIALLPVAFGLYAKHGAGHRWIVIPVAIAILLAAARLPISEYATATFKTDSQFLFAISYAQDRLGAGSASLFIALLAAAAAVLAVGLSYLRQAGLAAGFAIGALLAATLVATHVDLRITKQVRADLPHRLTWVDAAASGPVTAIETPIALKQDLLYGMYWNPAIKRELLLGTAVPTDSFSAPHLTIRSDGSLAGVRGDVLFHDFGTTGWFTDATRVASAAHFTLWRPRGGVPRLRLVIEGRFWDGWLTTTGRLRAWPVNRTEGVRVGFTLSLPTGWDRSSRVTFGNASFVVRPGARVQVTCNSGAGELDLPFTATSTFLDRGFRDLAARMTQITVTDRPAANTSKPLCSRMA